MSLFVAILFGGSRGWCAMYGIEKVMRGEFWNQLHKQREQQALMKRDARNAKRRQARSAKTRGKRSQ